MRLMTSMMMMMMMMMTIKRLVRLHLIPRNVVARNSIHLQRTSAQLAAQACEICNGVRE